MDFNNVVVTIMIVIIIIKNDESKNDKKKNNNTSETNTDIWNIRLNFYFSIGKIIFKKFAKV